MNVKPIRMRIVLVVITGLLLQHLVNPTSRVVAQSDENVDHVTTLEWSPDNAQIAVGTWGGPIYIWDVASGHSFHTLLGHIDGVFSLAWSPDGKRLASGGLDKAIRIWDTFTGKLLNTLTGHIDVVSGLFWAQDNSKIISTSIEDNYNFRIWDVNTGQMLDTRRRGSAGLLILSPDKTKLAIDYVGSIQIIDLSTFDPITILQQPEGFTNGNDVTAVAWSPDNSHIATGSRNGKVHVWDTSANKIVATLRANEEQKVDTEASAVSAISFNADGSKLMSISANGVLRTWDVQTNQILGTTQGQGPILIATAAWSSYRGRLAIGGKIDHTAKSAADTLPTNVIQVISPFPSTGELRGIVKRCGTSETQSKLIAQLASNNLQKFVDEVKTSTKEKIPPACAADLIAMASALQAK